MRSLIKNPTFLFNILFIGLLFFMAPLDTDLGWHLRYGNYVLESHRFMKTNLITYYLPDYYWSNSYTLYQIIIAFIFKYSHFIGLCITYSLLMITTYIVYNFINKKLVRINFFFFLFTVFFGWTVLDLGIRAQVFSLFFIILNILLITRGKLKLFLYVSPFIYLLWANLHGGFILGIAIIIFALIESVFHKKHNEIKYLSLILIFSIIGSLINPYGYWIYEEAIRHMRVPMHTLIAEWTRPSLIYSILTAALSTFGVYSLFKRKPPHHVFWILCILAFTYLTLEAKRNLPIFGLVFSLTITESYYKKLLAYENHELTKILSLLFLMVGIPFLLFFSIPKNFNASKSDKSYCSHTILPVPCAAIKFIRENNIPGNNVFSSYEWGGYLSWKLPEYKFFVDGRTPAWKTPDKKSPYTVYLELIQARPGYQEALDKLNTDWMLIGVGTFLDEELRSNPKTPWKEIFRDKISVIYVKK